MRPLRALGVVIFFTAALLSNAMQQRPAESPSPPVPTTPGTRPTRGGGGGGRKYPAYDPDAVERGHKQFVATCAFCHGSNAKGGESGPDLLRSILVLDDDHGDKIGPVILDGRPDKGMPKFALTPEQISDISAFLLDRVKAAALRGTYQILNIVVGDPKAGEAYFNGAGQCGTCHSVTADLAHIGARLDPVSIQQAIVMPRARGGFMLPVKPGGQTITVAVTLRSGDSFSGKLDHIDDFVVSLTDANGDYRSFARNGDSPKVEIRDPLKAHIEMLQKYTDVDIHNLTAYLVSLK